MIEKTSKSRIKRLRGQSRPQYTVEVLAIVAKSETEAWLAIGFESEDDWFDFRLEHDPRFSRRIEKARTSLRSGRGVRLVGV
jgi:hypothetical protein